MLLNKQFQTYSRSLVCPFMRWHGLQENISLKKRTPLPCVHHTSCYISHKSIDYFHPRFLVPQRPGGLHPKINVDMLNFVTKNCTGNIYTATRMNQKHIYLSCKELKLEKCLIHLPVPQKTSQTNVPYCLHKNLKENIWLPMDIRLLRSKHSINLFLR